MTTARRSACVAVLFLVLNVFSQAKADEVRLVNGDRLTGKIVKMEEGVLTFKTPYGGEISIDWKQVDGLKSDTPMTVRVPGDTKGRVAEFFYGEHDVLMTNEIGAGTPVPLVDIKSINLAPIRLKGTATIGGNSTSGNTDTKAVNAAVRFSIQAHQQRLMGEAKYNYGEAGSTVTARNSLGSLKYDYFVSQKVFFNMYGLLEKDTFQNLNLRTTLGAGVGYQFFDTPRTSLAGELGVAYVNEHYTNTERITTPSSRWAIRWEYALLPDRVKIFHRQEGFYDLNAGNAVRIRADQGIRVTLYKNLFLNLEYDLRHNTQPAPGRLETDQAFIFGVGYELQ